MSAENTNQVVGVVVRFTVGATAVDVTIDQNNPAVRDFLSMLPLTLKLEEFNGREKIGYLPRKLEYRGSPGSKPVDGDLIYFVPWGNIGFYYNAAGIGHSDQTIHLGTYKASPAQLKKLESHAVTVEIARQGISGVRASKPERLPGMLQAHRGVARHQNDEQGTRHLISDDAQLTLAAATSRKACHSGADAGLHRRRNPESSFCFEGSKSWIPGSACKKPQAAPE